MPPFEEPTKRNAKEYFDAYLGNMDAALQLFVKKLQKNLPAPRYLSIVLMLAISRLGIGARR
jgi:hypothetical protein